MIMADALYMWRLYIILHEHSFIFTHTHTHKINIENTLRFVNLSDVTFKKRK